MASELFEVTAQGKSLLYAQVVSVGGNGGDPFAFKCFSGNIWKISVTYSGMTLNTIDVTFNTGQKAKFGNSPGAREQKFELDGNFKIVSATLWPNSQNNRCGGLEFVFAKSNGERKSFSVKCDHLGAPVSVDVKSGRCCGIMGRSGDEIDALGFYFV